MIHHSNLLRNAMFLGAFAAGCVREDPPPMTDQAISAAPEADAMEMAKLYAAWSRTHPGGGAMPLDFSNDVHFRVLRNDLLASGKTPDNSPELFSRLSAARAKARAAAPGAAVDPQPPWCGQDLPFVHNPTSRVSARSRLSCTNGSEYYYASVKVFVTDVSHSRMTQLDMKSKEDYGAEMVTLTNEAIGSVTPAPDRMLFMQSLTTAYDEEHDYGGYQAVEVAAFAPDRAPSFQVAHPKEIQGGAPIRICLFRPLTDASGSQDCDYATVKKAADGTLQPFDSEANGIAAAIPAPPRQPWRPDPAAYFGAMGVLYNPNQGGTPVMAYVPMQGTYDSGAGARAECGNRSTIGTAQLFLMETGGACNGMTEVTPALSLPWTTFDPTNSHWAWRGLLNFGATCLHTLQDVTLTIRVINSNSNPACAGASFIQDIPMDFKNSCLAEGTLVSTGRGDPVPVESLAVGDKVVTDGKGRVLTVQSVGHGFEPFPMVRLNDDRGHSLMVTSSHPMLTDAGGVVAADQLTVGSRVMTREGPARLISVERVQHPGKVFNFVLGSRDEMAALGTTQRTLFANGFLVGDSVMQIELEDRLKSARRAARAAHLPSAWRRDFESSVARKTVAAR